jgi:hypothetical protein
MSTPYITPAMLTNAPTGAPWNMIPFPKASSAQQAAEQTNICWRATGEVDGFCNQPLRATLDTEQLSGPDYRLTVGPDGVGRAMLSRIPILDVVAAQVSARASFPRQWSILPEDSVQPEVGPIGVYGSTGFGQAGADDNAVLVAPGWVSWATGRNSTLLEVYYLNGWPHTSLVSDAAVGATVLTVDDVTAFAGAGAFIYDGASTEQVQVQTVSANAYVTVPGNVLVPTGPGTVTLAAATQYEHAAGIVVSAIPQSILWATTLYAAAEALTQGAGSLTIQSVPGQKASGGGGVDSWRKQAEKILARFRRVI